MWINISNSTQVDDNKMEAIVKSSSETVLYGRRAYTVSKFFKDEVQEHFNLMVTGESKSSGKWCDPVVRDEKMDVQIANWILSGNHEHLVDCKRNESPKNFCNCGYVKALDQAQSILEQSS